MASHALVPSLLSRVITKQNIEQATLKGAVVLAGVSFISLLAQVAIPLPFTPVPVTGQTFGVLLIALSFGRNLAFATTLGYLALGSFGVPVFASGQSGLILGPTLGYLLGMTLSSLIVGELSNRGWAKSTSGLIACCLISSLCIFSCGLAVLSQFVPADHLLAAGLYPFLIGDVIKSTLAISLIKPVQRLLNV